MGSHVLDKPAVHLAIDRGPPTVEDLLVQYRFTRIRDSRIWRPDKPVAMVQFDVGCGLLLNKEYARGQEKDVTDHGILFIAEPPSEDKDVVMCEPLARRNINLKGLTRARLQRRDCSSFA